MPIDVHSGLPHLAGSSSPPWLARQISLLNRVAF